MTYRESAGVSNREHSLLAGSSRRRQLVADVAQFGSLAVWLGFSVKLMLSGLPGFWHKFALQTLVFAPALLFGLAMRAWLEYERRTTYAVRDGALVKRYASGHETRLLLGDIESVAVADSDGRKSIRVSPRSVGASGFWFGIARDIDNDNEGLLGILSDLLAAGVGDRFDSLAREMVDLSLAGRAVLESSAAALDAKGREGCRLLASGHYALAARAFSRTALNDEDLGEIVARTDALVESLRL